MRTNLRSRPIRLATSTYVAVNHCWNYTSWWWGTGRPGVMQSLGLRRVGHDLATELQQINYSTFRTDGLCLLCVLFFSPLSLRLELKSPCPCTSLRGCLWVSLGFCLQWCWRWILTSVHSCRIESQRQSFDEKASFTGLPGKGRHSELMLSTLCPKVAGIWWGVS